MKKIGIANLPKCRHRHTILTHPKCFDNNGRALKDRQPKPYWTDDARLGFFDIETSNLKANFGVVLSWYIKVGGKQKYDKYVLSPNEIESGEYDLNSMKVLSKTLKKYDAIVTYYGKRFDIPFCRTRCKMHGIDQLPNKADRFPVFGELYHIDLYDTAKRRLALHSNRLAVVCDALGIKGKTPIDYHFWVRAMSGDSEAMKYIALHNKYDVKILESAFERFREDCHFPKSNI